MLLWGRIDTKSRTKGSQKQAENTNHQSHVGYLCIQVVEADDNGLGERETLFRLFTRMA
jgi:hypothetical protein